MLLEDVVLQKSEFLNDAMLLPKNLILNLDDLGELIEFDVAGNNFIKYSLEIECSCLPSVTYISFVKSTLQNEEIVALNTNILIFTGIIGVMILIIGISIFSEKISTPIHKLEKFASEITNYQYNDFKPDHKIAEINSLGVNMIKMKNNLQESQEEQNDLFSNVSHECKTPIMAIRGYAEGLKEGVFEDNAMVADSIIAENDRLLKLVNQLLTISKIESNSDIYPLEEVYPMVVISEIMSSVYGVLAERKIEICLNFDESIKIQGNSKLFYTAFSNIITNSLRYAKSKIYIDGFILGKTAFISFSNDGESIPEDVLSKIFHRFYKGDHGETGLGLTITKKAIESMNGNIYVYNNLDQSFFEMKFDVID